MDFPRTGAALAWLGLACALLASCRPGEAGKEPIVLGYIGALTGGSSSVGRWEIQGIGLAVDEENDRGGLCGGRKLRFVKYDDESDSTKSVILAQRLVVQDKALLVFATNNSQTTLTDLPIFTKARTAQMTSALVADITSKGSDYIFRSCGAGPVYETTLVDYLRRKGLRGFALISDTTAYGRGEADYQAAALRKSGGDALIRESYEAGDTDFSRQLGRILAKAPDTILLGALAVDSALIAAQARRLGFKGQIAGGASIGTPKFIEVAGAAAEGTLFASAYIDNDESDSTRDFARRYAAKWGEEPESHGAKAYDGAKMAIEAIERSCGNMTREEIARQLHATKGYRGLQGEFTYSGNGEGISRARIGIIRDGRLTAVADRAPKPSP